MEGVQLKGFKGNDSRGSFWTKPPQQVRDTPADIAEYVDMVYIDRRNDAEFKALGNKADDLKAIRLAYARNCPIVTMDNLKDWLREPGSSWLSPDELDWLQRTMEVHRKWSFHVTESGDVLIGDAVRPAPADDLGGLSPEELVRNIRRMAEEMLEANSRLDELRKELREKNSDLEESYLEMDELRQELRDANLRLENLLNCTKGMLSSAYLDHMSS